MGKWLLSAILLLLSATPVRAQVKEAPMQDIERTLRETTNKTEQAGLLCKLALWYIYKPGELATDLDHALRLLTKAEGINQQLKNVPVEALIYFAMSHALREKGDTAAGHRAIDKSIRLYHSVPPSLENGDAYIELSNYYNINTIEGCAKKKDCFEKALAQFEASGDEIRQADALKSIGDLNQLLRNYGLAMINLRKALAIYQRIGYKNLQGIYDLLGAVSTNIGDFSNAIQYGLEAVKVAENQNDTSIQLCTIYHRLGVAYGNWSKWEEADIYEKKALAIAIKYRDKDAIETVLLSSGYMLKTRSAWKDMLLRINAAVTYTRPWNAEDSIYMSVIYLMTYLNGENLDSAAKYAGILVRMAPRNTRNQSTVHTVNMTLTDYFLQIKDFKTARKYIDADMEYSKRYANKRTISVNYMLAAKADSGMHRFRQALKNYYIHKLMSDSMLNETKSFQLAQMQVAYETEKKDNDLKIKEQTLEVITNKSKIQELSLKKANLTRNVIAIAALAFISILVTGYQIKQRHNRKLELQQEEINTQNTLLKQVLSEQQKTLSEKEWLVKEIHHRVKNNLQMIISLLNAQSEFLEHPSAIKAIKESRERMQAISLIHQKLFQRDEGTLINMKNYIMELVEHLYNFADKEKIRFNLKLEDIELDVSQSVPLGLILNEAITNVVKYAFPDDSKGKVTIELQPLNGKELLLRISDNGQGFPAILNLAASDSLGIQLIKLFSEQLEGRLTINSDRGVEISVIFQQQSPADKRPFERMI